MRTLSRIPWLAALVSLSGCGPAPVPEVPTPPTPTPPAPAAPTVVSPARWLVRYPEAITSTASRKLPSGGTVHGGIGGQRWIVGDSSAPAPAAADGGAAARAAETASMILPERIVGILPVEQRWAFFGNSGRAFIASTPLGPIEEVRVPPVPVWSVSAGKAAAIAATKAGELLRTTDGGAHWTAVKAAALSPAVTFAVALRADGVGVALAAPQRALVTTDDGAAWSPLATPAGGPHLLDVNEHGEIWLARPGYQPTPTHRLDGSPPAFVGAKAPKRESHARADKDAARYDNDSDTTRALAGKRVLAVGRPSYSDKWKIQISELDRDGEWKESAELDECSGPRVAAMSAGDDFVMACQRKAEAQPGPADAGAHAPNRLVLYRSKDGGNTWAEDGEVPLWDGWNRVLAGPDGAIFVQRRCGTKGTACTPLALRPAAGQPFVGLTTPDDYGYGMFAFDGAHRALVAVGSSDARKKARFDSWSLDGRAGKGAELFATKGGVAGAVGVDEHGTIVVITRSDDGWKVLRSTDEGASFASEALPAEIKIRDVALTGDRGLVLDQTGRYWESASSGKTWHPVTGLVGGSHRTLACGRDGCVSGTELRLGWELAAESSPGPAVGAVSEASAAKVPGAAAFKCAAGETKAIPRALVDDFDELVVAGSSGGGRVTIPAATKDDGVEVVQLGASDNHLTAKATGLFGAAPNQSATGSMTEVMITPAGALALRATYPVDRSYADVWLSPVSAELSWWRPQAGKVVRGRLPPMGKGQMRGRFTLTRRAADRGGLFSLLPDGVVYRPQFTYADATEIFTFAESGVSKKISSPLLQSAGTIVRTPAGLTLLELPSPGQSATVARFGVAKDKEKEAAPQATWTLAPPSSGATVLALQRGADAAFVVAWSGPGDGPAHAFLVPVKAGDNPGEITEIGLGALLGERPRACGDTVEPGSVRLKLDLPRAVRRAVLIEGEKPLLARAEAVVVVVQPQGEPCVSEWIAHGTDGGEVVVIPVSGPGRAFSLSGTPADWKDGVTSREVNVRALRCEESAGLAIPASFSFKGF